MLAALVAGLLAATAPIQAETTTTGPHPGVVVLVASPLRDRAATLPHRAGAHVRIGLGNGGTVIDGLSTVCDVRAGLPSAEDRAVAQMLSAASDVELRAGAWIDWYLAAHDGRHEREWTRALRAAHARGARVVASGGAASWIAQHTVVPRDVVQKPSQDPHDRSPDVPVEGLGLFDAALVGVLADGAPTADRLIERAVAYGVRDVLLLEGDVALAWDPSARRATVHGPGTAAWIGVAEGTRSRGTVRAARAAVLSDGDAYDARRRTIVDGRAVEPGAVGSVLAFGPRMLRARLDGTERERPASSERERPAGSERERPAGTERERPASSAQGQPEAAPSWIASARAALDERSLRRPGGGWSGVVLDLEVRAP